MASNGGGVAALDPGVAAHIAHLKEELEAAWLNFARAAGYATAAQVRVTYNEQRHKGSKVGRDTSAGH